MAFGRGPSWLLHQIARCVELSLEIGPAAAHQRDDDLERLLEAGGDLILRQAEGMRLARPGMARAEAKDEAASTDLVECLSRLGDDARVAVQRGQHPGADLDGRGHCGGGTRDRDTIPHAGRRFSFDALQQFVGDPYGVEAHLLGAQAYRAHLLPARGAPFRPVLERVQHHADFEFGHGALQRCFEPSRSSLDTISDYPLSAARRQSARRFRAIWQAYISAAIETLRHEMPVDLPVLPAPRPGIVAPDVKDAVATTALLADGTRAAILALLRSGPHCVCEMAAATGERENNVSNHLARLRAAGLVRASRHAADARWVYYERDEEACAAARQRVSQLL